MLSEVRRREAPGRADAARAPGPRRDEGRVRIAGRGSCEAPRVPQLGGIAKVQTIFLWADGQPHDQSISHVDPKIKAKLNSVIIT